MFAAVDASVRPNLFREPEGASNLLVFSVRIVVVSLTVGGNFVKFMCRFGEGLAFLRAVYSFSAAAKTRLPGRN